MVRFLPGRRLFKSPGNPLTGAKNAWRYAGRAAKTLGNAPAYQSGSYAGRILYDEYNKMKAADSEFSNVRKNMNKKYTEGAISKIHKRYMKKPKKMDEKLKEITGEFVSDYNAFLTSYHTLFNTILQTMFTAQADHYNELKSFTQIVRAMTNVAKTEPNKLYFPKSSLDKFDRELGRAMNDLKIQLTKDYGNVKRLAMGWRYPIGFLSRFVRKKRLEMKEKNEIPKLIEEIESLRK